MTTEEFTEASTTNTDVLTTLAQLPNDEVYTPPRVVNKLLDELPENVWKQPEYRWLDPGTKSGVFLREVSQRLMVGLEKWQPDAHKRRTHILTNMLFGAAITSLSGDLGRRTLYQSADATGKSIKDKSILPIFVPMSSRNGNIEFVATNHTILNGRCQICRAPEALIRDSRESFAYSFIHRTYPTKEMQGMKFDVILGNPPFQIGMDDGQGNRTANITPLYNLFVERAIEMDPKYILMITPSRWFSGGHSLNDFRERMISDRRLRNVVDFPNGKELFPGVEVKGGISYFLWDRDYSGDCTFVQMSNGVQVSKAKRDLRDGQGVVIRDNFAAGVVKKVLKHPLAKNNLSSVVSARDPFGQVITTNFKGAEDAPFKNSLPLVFVNKVAHVNKDLIQRNHDWIGKYKVLLPKASDGRGGFENLSVLGEPIAVAPGSACTQSYLVAGTFENKVEAQNFAQYLTTKFLRFLVLQRKVSQDLTQGRFTFVPDLDMKRLWTDEDLYREFGLDEGEIKYIERQIAPRDWINSLESPIPETHLPGGRKFKDVELIEELAESEDEE